MEPRAADPGAGFAGDPRHHRPAGDGRRRRCDDRPRIVEATKLAFGLRDAHITDPRHLDVDIQSLLAAAALQPLADNIDDQQARPWGAGKGPGDTVWMGVIDNSGLAVSFIQSLYHEFGSGVVLPESGIVWQNRGASFSLDPSHLLALAPGKQPFHTLNPAAARLNDGRVMVYGSMGGDGQPQTQAAIFTRYVLQNAPLQESITRPRWLLGRTWGQTSDSLKLEGRFSAECVARLRQLGHDVEVLADFSEAMGHAGAIVRPPQRSVRGGQRSAQQRLRRRILGADDEHTRTTNGTLTSRKWNSCWRWSWTMRGAQSSRCSLAALPPWPGRCWPFPSTIASKSPESIKHEAA
ncbi:gamma-glutamyltranspeptidase [Klebsiella michiganensis]|nr:gamma-glutamyltranspeptidase [Klebsiella michiganensis]